MDLYLGGGGLYMGMGAYIRKERHFNSQSVKFITFFLLPGGLTFGMLSGSSNWGRIFGWTYIREAY